MQCLNCGHALAYLPDRALMAAVPSRGRDTWPYRLCANYSEQHVCNWAVPAEDDQALCQSCRLTRVIPQLDAPGKQAWARLEAAKRRLVHSLLSLDLPLDRQDEAHPDGVIFEFLRDSTAPNGDPQRVLTGHDNGLITINVAEADDVQREQQRTRQHEPYRTVLGHLRHEIGHYFWDRLIQTSSRLKQFRKLFGDERADYGESLERHYQKGPPPKWADEFISSYATSHPWEDWAESWAHFLHMTDTLETANASGLSLKPQRLDEPRLAVSPSSSVLDMGFDEVIERWLPLAYVMNNLSRGLGHADSYPFVLNPAVIEKLRFVHDTISEHRASVASRAAGQESDWRLRDVTALAGAIGRHALITIGSALALVAVAVFAGEVMRRQRDRMHQH